MVGDPARPSWILCVAFGAAVIAFVGWFAGVVPTQTCSGRPPAGNSVLLAYELSRTTADIEAVFGQEGDPCRAAMIAALDRANKVDLIAFIATYSGFLFCFFLALRRSGVVGLAHLGLVAVAATLVFDVLETSVQLHITASLPGSALSLVLLTIGSTGKFLGLAVMGACAGGAMLARRNILDRLAGAACMAGGLMVVLGLNYLPARSALPVGVVIAWLVMLLYAAVAAVRGAPWSAR